jgi:catechol O-methyltransferase
MHVARHAAWHHLSHRVISTLPTCLQELGTYCGYSTILLAAHLKDPSAKVYTIDICEENVAIAKAMIAHAGLTDRVVHIVKPLDQAVEVGCVRC